MDNTDVKVWPIGHMEFFINIDLPMNLGDPVVTASWRMGGSVNKPPLGFPKGGGTYTWTQGRNTAVFVDSNGSSTMSFDDFLYPPSADMTGDGQLLFGNKKGTTLNWFVY